MPPRLRALAPRLRVVDTRTAKPPAKLANPFYLSREWRSLVDRLVAERGRWCQDPGCTDPDCGERRIFGDHVVELQDGGAPLDPANVLLRCGSCHTRKTVEERARRQRDG